MLCELRKDIAHFLVLRTTFEKGAGKSRKSRRLLSPEAPERLEKVSAAASPPPSTELPGSAVMHVPPYSLRTERF